jgi:solute carrier family 25 citrate transporter 1
MKQAATSATRMGSYNILKEVVADRRKGQTTSKTMDQVVTFATGAAAGTITVYATQPFDTIKTRAQGAQGQSTMEAVSSVWRDSGVKGFWSGSTMRLGRLVLSGGIVFSVYENVAALLTGNKK